MPIREIHMQILNQLNFYFVKKFGRKDQRIKVLFDHHFFVNKYYLHKSANGENMARILNISNMELESLSIHNFSIGFETLRDMYRFQHFWNEFTNPVNAELPIQSIISLCGFNTVQEFNHLLSGHKEASKNILKKLFL